MEEWPLESSMLEEKEMEHWGGTGEHSEGEHVGEEGSLSTNPFVTYPNLRVRAESGDNFEINLEMVAGESPSSSSTSSSEGIVMDVDKSMSSIDLHLRATPSVKLVSPSSSSSTSSEDLFIVLDPKPDSSPFLLIDSPITTPQGNAVAASSSNSSELEEKWNDCFPGPMLFSPAPDVKPGFPPASPTKSPPLQVMDRTTVDGYDPYRIPASVFGKSPSATPQDWSVASNESLFSIHVGNSSFSRDHAIMLGDFKSGELFALSPKPQFTAPCPVPRSPGCAAIDKSNHYPFQPEKNVVVVPPIAEGNEMEAVKKQADEEERNPYAAIRVSSIKYSGKIFKHSHSGSGDSVKSFAFPIRKKECSWPSCYGCNCSQALRYCTCPKRCSWPSCYGSNCSQALQYCTCPTKCSRPSCHGSNCSRTLRYCTCPRCHFRRPSCHFSCCSWGFCYSWNCIRYCCSSCNLADRVRSDSDKTSADQDHHTAKIEENLQPSSTPNTPKSTSKQGGRGWFSCFPSWPSCNCPFRTRSCCC